MRRVVGVLVAAVVALTGCTAASPQPGFERPEGASTILAGEEVAEAVAALDQGAVAKLDPVRLADGLLPPTNRWFSGLVFGDEPQPVFPLPLSFGLADDGFGFGVPRVSATERTVAAPSVVDVAVGLGGAVDSVVTGYDELGVTIEQGVAGEEPVLEVTIVRGAPTVALRALRDATLTVPGGLTAAGDGGWRLAVDGREYALLAADAEVDGGVLRLPSEATATWVALPDSGALDLAGVTGAAGAVVQHTGGDDPSTTLEYFGRGDGDLLIARMPHQQAGSVAGECGLGAYDSIWGPLDLCRGSAITWSSAPIEPGVSLGLEGLDDAAREEIGAAIRDELATPDALPADTYFGGKALERLALLAVVADDIGADEERDAVVASLGDELRRWLTADGCAERAERCFTYDPDAGGIVGQVASFGADEFNDHHFHWGGFLVAASVAVEFDPGLLSDIRSATTLLAADIASAGGDLFPTRRPFDAYAGHSWASGTSPFADGNNQESSSEAVNAWNGVAMWAEASGDTALRTEGEWLLAAEAASASRYWIAPETPAGFTSPLVSINWGGKRDYATWFSAEPSAILGIQLLPMTAAHRQYLSGDAAVADEAILSALDGPLSDYVILYAAERGAITPEDARQRIRDRGADALDDGLSLAYALALLHSLD